MRRLILLSPFFLLACGQGTTKTDKVVSDTTKTPGQVINPAPANSSVQSVTPGAAEVNGLLKYCDGGQWHVVTDAESGWMKDAIDYFVVPERKKDPDYPYIARGDFDCDGKADIAALVTDNASGKKVKIVYFLGENKKVSWWKEDVQGAAIRTYSETELAGFRDEKEKKVKLKCNALSLEWYEKSAYVIYWDGKKLDNLWTAD